MTGKSPTESVISAFGGQNALARILGVSQGTVWGWSQSGFIPSRRIPQIIEAGLRQKPMIELTYAQFFIAPPPQRSAAQTSQPIQSAEVPQPC